METLRLLAPSSKPHSRKPNSGDPFDDGDSDDDAPPRFADSDLEEDFEAHDDFGMIFEGLEEALGQMPPPGAPILPVPAGGVFPGMPPWMQPPGGMGDEDEEEDIESDEESWDTIPEEDDIVGGAGSSRKRVRGGGHAGLFGRGGEPREGKAEASEFPVFDSAEVSEGEENAEEEGWSDEDGGGRGPRVPGAIDAGRRVQVPRKRGRVVLDQGHYRLFTPNSR